MNPNSASPIIRPGSLHAWFLAIRFKTLPVGMAPVLLGTACVIDSKGTVNLFAFIAAMLGAVLLQIGSNFANDAFDFVKGTDTKERLGPLRTAQAGLLTPNALKWGIVVVFLLAAIDGAYLVWLSGWPIVVIGLVSMGCAVAYTGGPYPLGYLGLGDLFVFIFFGPVAVCGTSYVTGGQVTWLSIIASIGVGALSTAVLVVNNIRDEDSDRATGKKTLIVRLGRSFGVWLFCTCMAIPLLVPGIIYLMNLAHWPVFFSLGIIPLVIWNIRRLYVDRGAKLNTLLGKTAMTTLVYALLLSIGILLDF